MKPQARPKPSTTAWLQLGLAQATAFSLKLYHTPYRCWVQVNFDLFKCSFTMKVQLSCAHLWVCCSGESDMPGQMHLAFHVFLHLENAVRKSIDVNVRVHKVS